MSSNPARWPAPLPAALGVVGLTLVGLLAGFEPIGSDPELLYRPIKSELARALRMGGLPLWSDRFGLGTPLAAESHAAAFYPVNWLLYRVADVGTAYRLAMWGHYVALAGTTFFYARILGLSAWGGALASVGFALSGFASSHAGHEPFYQALAFLPLSLGFAERYLADGRAGWLAAVALAFGAQLTLGHFQIQAWTAGLLVLTALSRGVGGAPWRRSAALVGAVGWGAGVAFVQLALTWELTRVSRFDRPLSSLTNYVFPPDHWAQPALPWLYLGFRGGRTDPYWGSQRTSAEEACLYVGTIPLVLAFVGYWAPRDRALKPWRWLTPLGFALATLPGLWPEGYRLLLYVPGLNLFRCPGRYVLFPCLGLSLLAGRGFDRALPGRRFWPGFGLALAFGIGALAWGLVWSSRPDVQESMGAGTRARLVTEGVVAWVVALAAVAAWRAGKASPWVPFLAAACELAFLFYNGPYAWGRPIDWATQSPAYRRLIEEPSVEVVGGWNQNLPVRLGVSTADLYLGIPAPPPNYLLDAAVHPELATFPYERIMRHYGVSHGVVTGPSPFPGSPVLFEGKDELLDRVLPKKPGEAGGRTYRVERYETPFPRAWAATKPVVVKDWYEMLPALSRVSTPDTVLFLKADAPKAPGGPPARSAAVVRWDGRSGEVEHDGACDLVIRRAYYPGWVARVDGGPEVPVVPADGGLQSVRLSGSGTSRVSFRYRPTRFGRNLGVSLAWTSAAVLVLIVPRLRRGRTRAASALR